MTGQYTYVTKQPTGEGVTHTTVVQDVRVVGPAGFCGIHIDYL